jgi:hypothetical protein
MAEAKESTSATLDRPESRAGAGERLTRLWSSRWQPLFLAGGLAVGSILARFALQFQLPLPFCMLRHLTGIPCPGCGATRSLAGWSHLDPLEALRFNPLFFALTVGIGAWAVATLADWSFGTRWVEGMKKFQKFWANGRLLIFLLGANWLYLWLTLPK